MHDYDLFFIENYKKNMEKIKKELEILFDNHTYELINNPNYNNFWSKAFNQKSAFADQETKRYEKLIKKGTT